MHFPKIFSSKYLVLFFLTLLLSGKLIAQTKKIMIIHTEPIEFISDVNNLKTKLLNTNKFNSVDIFDAKTGTPTLSNLLNYDAVLITSDLSYADPVSLGNVIADYIDAGGGVVNSLYSENSPREWIVPGWGDVGINLDLSSRFYTKNYNLFSIQPYTWGSPQNLGFKKIISSHPILNGVNTFSGGEASYTSDGIPTLTSGSSVIASWSNDWPLVIVNDDIGSSHVKRVDLNFYAIVISDGIDRSLSGWFNGGWDASSDGALLIANSLLYVCNGLNTDPSFANPGPINVCINASYYLNPSTTNGSFSTLSATIATVNASGYVTGVSEGTTTVSLVTEGGTVTATVTVAATSTLAAITDGLASYKFNNNPQGPIGGIINYVGYNGFDYSSQTRPINTGFYRASIQSGNEAGCPYEFYIFRCTTCGTVPEYTTRPQGTLSGNTILPGSPGQLTYTSSNSPAGGPFTIVYQASGASPITINNISSTVAFNVVTPTTTTSYNLISVTDENTKATTDFSGKTATVTILSDYVTIGTQVWTNKNLDVTTYRDGTVIPQETDPTAWANLTTGAWCYYENNSTNGTTYGKLYNWYAVAGIFDEESKTDVSKRKNLAPTGWHVPTETEWTTLIDYLGGASVAGGKLKATGTNYWTDPNTGTNWSGFSALPSGAQFENGGFGFFGWISTMWSSTSLDANTSRNFYIMNYSDVIFPFDGPVKRGKAVRLVKN